MSILTCKMAFNRTDRMKSMIATLDWSYYIKTLNEVKTVASFY